MIALAAGFGSLSEAAPAVDVEPHSALDSEVDAVFWLAPEPAAAAAHGLASPTAGPLDLRQQDGSWAAVD